MMRKELHPSGNIGENEIGKYLAEELNQAEIERFEKWLQNQRNQEIFLEYKEMWELPDLISQLKSIDEEKARAAVMNNISGFRKERNLFNSLQKIAAVLFIPLLLGSMGYIYHARSRSGIQTNTNKLDVSYGTVMQLELSDGTKVWLNSGSHFEYPTTFRGKTRKVYLEGHAYFEVAKNRKPFVVGSSDIEVVARGTAFDVLAYHEYKKIQTTLAEGVVDLYQVTNDTKRNFLATLSPNQSASYLFNGNKELIIRKVDANKTTAWRNGKLVFDNTPFEEITQRLSMWFNTDIRLIDPELKSYRYTATFTDETLWQVLELLENSAPVTYTYSKRNKNPDGSFTNRQVELKIKP